MTATVRTLDVAPVRAAYTNQNRPDPDGKTLE